MNRCDLFSLPRRPSLINLYLYPTNMKTSGDVNGRIISCVEKKKCAAIHTELEEIRDIDFETKTTDEHTHLRHRRQHRSEVSERGVREVGEVK
jgi:hypothetical protein